MTQDEYYPASLEIEYPDRELDRITTFLRPIVIIPIGIVLGLLNGPAMHGSRDRAAGDDDPTFHLASVGVVFLPTVLMLLFRRKYPRWWFDWNLELTRFSIRCASYLALLRDEYPSTDEEQAVYLDIEYPEARELSRWLPLVKWLLAIPHYIILFFLNVAAFLAVIVAWFAILLTGRYPRGLFDFVEGVFRWDNRVIGYVLALVTDPYPPLRLVE